MFQHAIHVLTYTHTHAPPRDAESVGLDVGGRAMLIPADHIEALVHAMGETFTVPGESS